MQGPIKRRVTKPVLAKPALGKSAKGKPAGTAAVPKPAARTKPAKRPAETVVLAPMASPPAAVEKQAPEAGRAKEKKPSKNRTEPLNFRVSAEFRRAFKRAAAAQDCKKVELLERIFSEWSARNPGSDSAA